MTHTLDILLQILIATIIVFLWLKVISSWIKIFFDIRKKRKVLREIDERVGQLDKLYQMVKDNMDKTRPDKMNNDEEDKDKENNG